MAHENIADRRICVKEALNSGHAIDLIYLSKKYNCSTSAIKSDICFFKKIIKNAPSYPNKKLKLQILQRDGNICQYCLKERIFIDHIIPTSMGGCGEDYNLVAICGSCNIKKGKNGKIWIPKNIIILKKLNRGWSNAIIHLFNKYNIPK